LIVTIKAQSPLEYTG